MVAHLQPPRTIVQPYFLGGANVHANLAHDFLGQPLSPPQTADWSVQPFLHSRLHIFTIRYTALHSPQICPFLWGIWTPIQYIVHWPHRIHHPKRHAGHNILTTRSIWKMLGPFATASRRTPPVLILHCHSPGVATVDTTTKTGGVRQ